MKLSITGFRGISEAEIETADYGITLLAAPNHQGKTSAVQAVAAALTGKTVPVQDLPKNQAWMLLRNGETSATVNVECKNGTAGVAYPKCDRITTGTPVEISEAAAGLRSLVDEPVKTRAQLLTELLRAYPTKEQLAAELKKLSEAVVNKLWENIKTLGWDGAHKEAADKGKVIKGQWREITGENYGSKKATSWLPAAWESDLDTATEAELQKQLQEKQDWLDVVKSDSAVNEAEHTRLKKLADSLPTVQKKLDEKIEILHNLEKNRSDIEKGLERLPKAEQPQVVPCPHCGGKLSITGDVVAIPKILTDEEIANRKKAIDSCRESLENVNAEIAKEESKLSELKAEKSSAEDAAKQLSKTKRRRKGESDPKEKIPELTAQVERAQNRLNAYRAKARADQLARQIEQNADVVALLAPDGLRLAALKTALENINETLADVCKNARWGNVEIKSDMQVTLDNRFYMMLSESEKFRVRVSLQLAFALSDGSQVVLIDGADILDRQGRNGLVRALHEYEIEAIVAMTIDKREDVPNLEKIGGARYWIEGGKAVRI